MKRVCITYHLFVDHSKPSDDLPHNTETLENCITTSFPDAAVDDMIENQGFSEYVHKGGKETVSDWIDMLARLQGYDKGYFVLAELPE